MKNCTTCKQYKKYYRCSSYNKMNENLLKSILLYGSEDALIQLYSNIEPLLKKVISNVTIMYNDSFRKKLYYNIYIIEKEFRETGFSDYISMAELTEDYKTEFIEANCSESYNEFNHDNYSLLTPFWELLHKLKVKHLDKLRKSWGFCISKSFYKSAKIKGNLNLKYAKNIINKKIWDSIVKEIDTYKYTYANYLATKFCDQYWLFLKKCLRRDFHQRKNRNKDLYVEDLKIKYSSDFVASICEQTPDIETSIFIKETICEFKKCLSPKETLVFDLLLNDYLDKEIESALNISNCNLRKIKCSIHKKYRNINNNFK